MARKNNGPQSVDYDPNGNYLALVRIRHPEATHKDGCIDPKRPGDPKTFTMKHRNKDEIRLLVEERKAIKPVEEVSS